VIIHTRPFSSVCLIDRHAVDSRPLVERFCALRLQGMRQAPDWRTIGQQSCSPCEQRQAQVSLVTKVVQVEETTEAEYGSQAYRGLRSWPWFQVTHTTYLYHQGRRVHFSLHSFCQLSFPQGIR
jgi:hypothetical protein